MSESERTFCLPVLHIQGHSLVHGLLRGSTTTWRYALKWPVGRILHHGFFFDGKEIRLLVLVVHDLEKAKTQLIIPMKRDNSA